MEYYQTSDKKLFYVQDLAHNHAKNLKDKTVNKVNSKDLKADQKQKSTESKPKQNTSKQGKEKPVVEADKKADVSKENVETKDKQESTDSKETTENVDPQSTEDSKTKD